MLSFKLGRCGCGFKRNDIRLDDRKLIAWSRTFRDKLTASHLPMPHFVQLTGSLLCSQDPSTGPCPNPVNFSPYSHTYFFKITVEPSYNDIGLYNTSLRESDIL
jgi:hypothetical protein